MKLIVSTSLLKINVAMIKIAGVKSNDKINFREFVEFFYKVDWFIIVWCLSHLNKSIYVQNYKGYISKLLILFLLVDSISINEKGIGIRSRVDLRKVERDLYIF